MEPASEMLQTVFLFFKILNAQERAEIGDSRDAWNVVTALEIGISTASYHIWPG